MASFAGMQVISNAVINAIMIAVAMPWPGKPGKHRVSPLVRCLRCLLLLRPCTTPGPFCENVCRWLSWTLRVRCSIVSKVLSNDFNSRFLYPGQGERVGGS